MAGIQGSFRMAGVAALALAAALSVEVRPAAACGPQSYIGSICTMAGNWCPEGTLPADGAQLQVQEFPALYAVIGSTYGGDQNVFFNLPDLRGRSPVGVGEAPGLSPVYLGQTRGNEMIELGVGELPTHSHQASLVDGFAQGGGIFASPTPGTSATPTAQNNMLSAVSSPAASLYGPGTDANVVPLAGAAGGSVTGEVVVQEAGSGGPFPVLPPQAAMNFCIVVQGEWPPRP